MNTNTMELNMNELEKANGGWELWDILMTRFVHNHFVHLNDSKTETDRNQNRT